MKNVLTAWSLAFIATSAMAQEGYSAKSLFFDESDSVVTVATGQKTGADANIRVAGAPAVGASGANDTPKAVLATSQQDQHLVRVAHKKSKQSGPLGASYFIRLKSADGSTRDVLASRTFKSGERFQLGVKVSRPAYVYVLNQAPDGTVSQIYPQPSQDNFVNAMGVVFLPGKGSFEFDNKPGVEQLLVFLSPEPAKGDMTQQIRTIQPDLISDPRVALHTAQASSCAAAQTAAATPADTTAAGMSAPSTAQVSAASGVTLASTNDLQIASNETGYAAKGIAFAPDDGCGAATENVSATGYAAKGIVFSDDDSPAAGGQVASYVVKRTTQTAADLYLKINLVHE
ncbi:DUF4384 domain-containing protein [Caballeronia sp. M23-90]|jgi:hypothetical protein